MRHFSSTTSKLLRELAGRLSPMTVVANSVDEVPMGSARGKESPEEFENTCHEQSDKYSDFCEIASSENRIAKQVIHMH